MAQTHLLTYSLNAAFPRFLDLVSLGSFKMFAEDACMLCCLSIREAAVEAEPLFANTWFTGSGGRFRGGVIQWL